MFVDLKIQAYQLTNKDLKMCERISEERTNPKRGIQYQGFNLGGLSPRERSFLGLFGEVAVSRFLEVEFDQEIYGIGGDGLEGDLRFKGRSISVKYTAYRTGNLMLYEKLKDDIIVLCCQGRGEKNILPPESRSKKMVSRGVDIVGWVDRERFLVESEIREGKKKCRFYSRDLLYPMATLSEGVKFL